ncbi:hypothetical protein HPB47_007985, partial [Ixodes persulcatus]
RLKIASRGTHQGELRGAIDMITAWWWQAKATTIQKCFRNAGFVRDAGNSENTDRRGRPTTDAAIVAAVRGSGASPLEDESHDDDEESTPEASSKDAPVFL